MGKNIDTTTYTTTISADKENVVSLDDLKILIQQEELENKKQDRDQRKKYANKIFKFLCWFVAAVVGILVAELCIPKDYRLGDSVMIALLSSTTIDVIGLFAIVARYLFPNRRIK